MYKKADDKITSAKVKLYYVFSNYSHTFNRSRHIMNFRLCCRIVKSDRAIILLNLCIALLIALALFLAGVGRTDNEVLYTFRQQALFLL